MRLAWLSPLPPVRSGVSEYAADLLPELARRVEVVPFAPVAPGQRVGALAVEPIERFDAAAFDLAVYHMGNNVHHRFVAEQAVRFPGLLVLHDLVLHHYWVEETLARGREEDYVALLRDVYGEVGEEAARARIHLVSSEAEYFSFPLFEPLAAASRAVAAHNRRAVRAVGERIENVPVGLLPMGIPDPGADLLPGREEARRALGIAPEAKLVALFGFLTPIKRPEACLAAFARLARREPRAELVTIGEVSPAVDLAGEAERLGIGGRVRALGYLDYSAAKRWLAAADVFLNLRWPTAGETSASLLRLLGWGRPVVISQYAQFREVPDAVAIHVAPGPAEVEELYAVLELLVRRPEIGRALGEAAASWVRGEHSLERAARALVSLAEQAIERPAGPGGRIKPLLRRRTSRTPRRPSAAIEGGELPARVPAGSRIRLAVRLRNTGDTTWLRWWTAAGGWAAFGGHLRDREGRALGHVGPAALTRDVAPGEEIDAAVEVVAPRSPGRIEVVADVLIDGWGWLGDRGSPARVFTVDVVATV